MNIAILFSGNIRSFEKCKETFIKEFQHLNADCFVTTYDTQYNFRDYLGFNKQNEVFLSEEDIKRIVSDLNPKHIIIDNLSQMVDFFYKEKEKFDSRIINNGTNDKIAPNHFLQFYKIKKALEIITDYELLLNKKYDILIRTRMDLLVKNIQSLDLFNIDLSKNIILGYEDISRINYNSPQGVGWQDMFFISTLDNIKNVVDNLLSEFYTMTIEKSAWGYPHGIFESGILKSNLKQIDMNLLHHVKRFGDLTTQIA
jgi:hypothetical protein